jgi:hypothetical protein
MLSGKPKVGSLKSGIKMDKPWAKQLKKQRRTKNARK